MARSTGSYIDMRQRRYNFFPQSFRWQGCTYHVQQVERSWAKMGGLFSRRRAERLCFRVRTLAVPFAGVHAGQPGRLDIYQDLVANTWHVDRILA